MKTPRRQVNIVVDLRYDKLKISENTLLFCEDWSAHFATVVAPCCIEAQWGVVTFSSDAFSDVSAFAKDNFVSNFWYVNNISQHRSFLIR